jgi:hypothetical protein
VEAVMRGRFPSMSTILLKVTRKPSFWVAVVRSKQAVVCVPKKATVTSEMISICCRAASMAAAPASYAIVTDVV